MMKIYNEKSYDTLSEIAPILAGDFFSMSYEDHLRFLGRYLVVKSLTL